MFDRFTRNSIKVIMLAQEEGRRLGFRFVGTEQILLGLISEREGIAAQACVLLGITLEAARLEVDAITGRGTDTVPVEMPFTPRAKRVLELAWHASRERVQQKSRSKLIS